MTDFANLIMTADATGLKQGEAALDSIAAKGAQAETKVTKATTGMSKGMKDVGGSASRLGPAVQNASYQVGDFAVQIASGGNAATAFAQQMPQLLGSFGMFGALAGAAVAVGAALWPVFFDSADGAKEMEKALKDLNEKIEEYASFAKLANASSQDLAEKFGNLSGAARGLMEGMARLSHLEALESVRITADKMEHQFKGLKQDLADIAEAQAQGATTSEMVAFLTGEMKDKYGLTVEQAQKLDSLLEKMRGNRSPHELAAAMEDVAKFMQDAVLNASDLDAEQIKQAKSATEAALAAAQIAANTDEAGAATISVTAATDDWAAAMASVNAQLAGAYSLISAIGGGMVQRAGISAANAVLDAGGSAISAEKARRRAEERQNFINKASTAEGYMPADMIDAQIAEMERQWATQDEYDVRLNAVRESEREAKKKPKRGKKAKETPDEKWRDDVVEYQRETAAFLAQADALAKVTAAGGDWERALAVIEEEQQLLNAAQKAGIKITPDLKKKVAELAEAHVDAEEKLERLRTATERGEDAFKDLFGSILDGADAAKEALANLLAEIAKVQFSKGMMSLLGQTSWGSGLLQSVGNLLSYDGGGYTGDGARSGGLDGKGGFLAMMHPQETVTDHTKGQSGATSVHVTVGMDESGNLQVRKIAQQEAASMGQAVSASIPGRIQQYSANPRRR